MLRGTRRGEVLKHKHDWLSPGERMDWTGREEREQTKVSNETPGEQGVRRGAIQR